MYTITRAIGFLTAPHVALTKYILNENYRKLGLPPLASIYVKWVIIKQLLHKARHKEMAFTHWKPSQFRLTSPSIHLRQVMRLELSISLNLVYSWVCSNLELPTLCFLATVEVPLTVLLHEIRVIWTMFCKGSSVCSNLELPPLISPGKSWETSKMHCNEIRVSYTP